MERRVYSAKMRRLAAQAYKRHPMQLCLWVLEQIALRAVALSPLYIALRLGYSMTAALILCLALYLLMIYPMRFRAALTLTRMVRLTDASGLRPASYPARVGAGALRLLLGGVWGMPFAFLIYRLYQYIFVLPGSRFNHDFLAIGAFLGAAREEMQMAVGTLVFFGLIFTSLLLFLYGWWRGAAYDFQLVGNISPIHALHNARRARRLPHVRSALRKNALIHMLICLPAILLPPLAPYLHLRAMLTGQAMADLQLLYAFFKAGMVSGGVVYIAVGLFLLLYLPFLPYRKLRNAAVVVNAYADVR